MSTVPCLGLLLLATTAAAQEPPARNAEPVPVVAAIEVNEAPPAAEAPLVDATVDAEKTSSAADAAAASKPPQPPQPAEKGFSVPEPMLLLAVGGVLVWLALAKRRVGTAGPRVTVARETRLGT